MRTTKLKQASWATAAFLAIAALALAIIRTYLAV